MCIQIKTIFRCSCPYQNTTLCPHHVYIRDSQSQINAEGKYAPDGFQLRLQSALQAHKEWTPLPQDRDGKDSPWPRWDHCAAYRSRYCRDLAVHTNTGIARSTSPAGAAKRDPKGKGKGNDFVIEGKEHICPNWVRTEETVSRLVRDLCFLCEDLHGQVKAGQQDEPGEQEEKEEEAEFTVDYVRRRAVESRLSSRSASGNNANGPETTRVSTQSPVRRILSQVKQKVIRESLMGSSTPSSTRSLSATGEAKDSQGDVFSRLQGDAARKRGKSVSSSVGSGSRAGTPGPIGTTSDKGRPSSRRTAKKPTWGGGGGGKK